MFFSKLALLKQIIIQTIEKVVAYIEQYNHVEPQPEPQPEPHPEPQPEPNLTDVPPGTDQAVVVYDQSGDGNPDTFVRLSTDDVEDPDDLDSYVNAANARLDANGTEAELQKVIFEDANGTVTKVLYRTDDGWSETDPNAETEAQTDDSDIIDDLMDSTGEDDLADAGTDTAEEDLEDA